MVDTPNESEKQQPSKPHVDSGMESRIESKVVTSSIKERNLDDPIIMEESSEFSEEPKKMSKFKMRQMKNKY